MVTWDDFLTNSLLQAGIGIVFGFAMAAGYCINAIASRWCSFSTAKRTTKLLLFNLIKILNIVLFGVFMMFVKISGTFILMGVPPIILLIAAFWVDRIIERGRK